MTIRALFLAFLGIAACAPEEAGDRRLRTSSAAKSEDANECYSLVQKAGSKRFPLSVLDDGILVSGDLIVGRREAAPDEASGGMQLSLGTIANFFGHGTAWPNGVVPYEFIAGSTVSFQNSVKTALTNMQNVLSPTITFVVRTNQQNYIVFKSVAGNLSTSALGMVTGAQEVRLGAGWTQPVLYHEMGHALGMMHEQQRWDRDQYLKVNDANIPNDMKAQVEVFVGDTVGSFDFSSIMLYDSCGGYMPTGCPSPWYVRKANNTQIRAPQAISAGDIATISYLYSPAATVDAFDLLSPQYKYAASTQRLFPIFAMPTDAKLTMVTYNASGYWEALGRSDIPPFFYGGPGHVPVPGNYYGDVADEQAVFFAAKRKWIAGQQTYEWPTEAIDGPLVPVPFRYSGGDFLDLAVFSRATGSWHIKGMAEPVVWSDAKATDVPVPGAYGDTRGKIAWFNPLTGYFGFHANKEKVKVGEPGDKPVPVVADFDLDGKDDPAIYYFATGKFNFLGSKTGKLFSASTSRASNMPFAQDFDRNGTVKLRLFDSSRVGADFDVLANAVEIKAGSDPDVDDPSSSDAGSEDDANDDEGQAVDSGSGSDTDSEDEGYKIEKHECP